MDVDKVNYNNKTLYHEDDEEEELEEAKKKQQSLEELEQLRREASVNREKVSVVVQDLISHCRRNQRHDSLLSGFRWPRKNPYDQDEFCLARVKFKLRTIRHRFLKKASALFYMLLCFLILHFAIFLLLDNKS